MNRGRQIRGWKQPLSLRHLEARGQLLLPFRPAVLEPGFDLDFGEAKGFGQFHALAHAEILVDFKFGLQPLQLLGAVGLAGLPVQAWFPGSSARGLRS